MKLLNDGWQFAKGEPKEFVPVSVPHDWLIADTNNLYKDDIGWYKRELDVNNVKDGQRLFIRFDGVYMDSTLYVNDQEVGQWKYGYTAFEFDLTDYISKNSINTILLKVVHQAPNSRWYTGAGIYRDVFLIVKNAYHFVSDGIYITTRKVDGKWSYEVDAEIETEGRPFEVRHTLLEKDDEIVEWDVEHPMLYTLQSELLIDGELADTVDTRFGFRTIAFTTDQGFFLNGRHVKLNGVCLHHDLGGLGAAVYPDAIRRQLAIFRKMGVNAIRVSHNPPASIFNDIADEMGFLVMSEIFDVWKRPKTKHDYARFFDEWAEKDVASWIRRDRNHPSIIMWSVGNEVYDTHADAETGIATMTYLMELVKKHDPHVHAPVTLCSNYMPWENTQKCADVIKLIGYNYAESLYDKHHAAHPDWIIYGSETCSTVQSRGIYHFPLSKSILADDDLQCSALGNSATSWGAKSVEWCIQADADTPFSLGQFIWAGQDYLGEPTPYHTKNTYLGHVDTAGFPKDSYYLFKAAWTDYREEPFVHLYPYWDFSEGQPIDVRVCSNAPQVELFVNEESQGIVSLDHDKIVADWQINYRTGTLRAVAYDGDGIQVAQQSRTSFGDAVKLQLENEIIGGLVFTTITALDSQSNPVDNANCRVQVSVQNGTLLALDNGDATDYDQYQTDSRRLFSGKLLAIVQRIDHSVPVVHAQFVQNEVPIRKIELTVDGYQVKATTFPTHATYSDLYWRVTDAAGIDSQLATIVVAADGQSATIKPRGDGEVYVRCSPKNGGNHFAFISMITLQIEGLGKPFMNPYEFVSGGLYNESNVELTNGNERGVATLRDGESHVAFQNLDFGDYGSDEITLPLFPLSKDPFTFEIWEGMPLEGGELLSTIHYDKGSIWNTYQDVVCKLPRRLIGVTTLCLVFRQKVHIKGFTFSQYQKAFQQLKATEATTVYGDCFTVREDTIEQIGNNVSLVYENMDFGELGASQIEICWRSHIAQNSIQLVFTDDQREIRQMIEVASRENYTSAVFNLDETITGTNKVSLIFLPGCNIDIGWLQFFK
ncbi:beta-galactosidase [Paenibacillus qinlingensis]|uniref:Beta-galactosidase n=2 Tax=Paenibacillus qinlingensis TaxID=1837343 RepID=A0ABU1P2C3_9BACL|nr:beta-galactosidase [Paenibacillus qinlingensis]